MYLSLHILVVIKIKTGFRNINFLVIVVVVVDIFQFLFVER